MDNQVIWIIGSSGAGKTTQSRLLHKFFQELSGINPQPYLIKGKDEQGNEYKYMKMGLYSSHIGELNSNQCSGTDSIKTKNDLICTFNRAKQGSSILIVDGILATAQWNKIFKSKQTQVILIHLSIDLETNLKRLAERRARKKNIPIQEVEITTSTKESLSGKIRGFKSLYDRMKGEVDERLEIQTIGKSINEIHSEIISELKKIMN